MKGMSRHGSVGLFAAQHRELDVAVGQNIFDPRFSVFNPFLICIPYFGPCPCECSSGEKWPHLSTHQRLPVEVQWCVQDAVRQLTHLMRLCIVDFLMLQMIRIMVSGSRSMPGIWTLCHRNHIFRPCTVQQFRHSQEMWARWIIDNICCHMLFTILSHQQQLHPFDSLVTQIKIYF